MSKPNVRVVVSEDFGRLKDLYEATLLEALRLLENEPTAKERRRMLMRLSVELRIPSGILAETLADHASSDRGELLRRQLFSNS